MLFLINECLLELCIRDLVTALLLCKCGELVLNNLVTIHISIYYLGGVMFSLIYLCNADEPRMDVR